MKQTLEEAAQSYSLKQRYEDEAQYIDFKKEAFLAGTKWQAEQMFTEDQMFLFAGYCMGKRLVNPEMDATLIMEDFKKEFKINQDA